MISTNLLNVQLEVAALLDRVSAGMPLSKRSISALLFMTEGRDSSFSNEQLRDLLVQMKLSSTASAKKDASVVKSELLDLTLVEIERKLSVVKITERGRKFASDVETAFEAAIDSTTLPEDFRQALRLIGKMPALSLGPKPTESTQRDNSFEQPSLPLEEMEGINPVPSLKIVHRIA